MRGADSLSARFAAARTPALRNRGNTAATRENATPAAIANPCRGRCSHCARRRVSEANRTAGPALRPEIVPGCSRRRGVREGHAPLLHAVRGRPAKWACRSRPGERRAGCPHPAEPRGGGNVPDFEPPRCGGRERPPYGPGKTRRPTGKMQPPRCTVGADSISARFTAAQGSAGGINPAPTNKFYVLGQPRRPLIPHS